MNVVVIGGGVCGLTCARTLARAGTSVTVVDKGRGFGGRLSTRRVELEDGSGLRFDHGAVAFDVTDARFQEEVDQWIRLGVASRWSPRAGAWSDQGIAPVETPVESPVKSDDLFVGSPGMNRLCAHLGDDSDLSPDLFDLRFSTQADRIKVVDGSVRVGVVDGEELECDAAVVAAPAPQAAVLLSPAAPILVDAAERVSFTPCWALMFAAKGIETPFEDILVGADTPIARIVRDDSKPDRDQRPGVSRWVAHASAAWTNEHLEHSREDACEMLLARALDVLGANNAEVLYARAHRWRYARAARGLEERAHRDGPLILCGDGFGGMGVEGAYLSGLEGANAVLSL